MTRNSGQTYVGRLLQIGRLWMRILKTRWTVWLILWKPASLSPNTSVLAQWINEQRGHMGSATCTLKADCASWYSVVYSTYQPQGPLPGFQYHIIARGGRGGQVMADWLLGYIHDGKGSALFLLDICFGYGLVSVACSALSNPSSMD